MSQLEVVMVPANAALLVILQPDPVWRVMSLARCKLTPSIISISPPLGYPARKSHQLVAKTDQSNVGAYPFGSNCPASCESARVQDLSSGVLTRPAKFHTRLRACVQDQG